MQQLHSQQKDSVVSGTTQPGSLAGDLSVDEFAQEVGLSSKAVRNGVGAGRIPSYKVGTGSRRIPRSYLDDLRASAYDDREATIQRVVDAAPRFTAAQRDKLAVLLTPASEGTQHAARKKS